MLLKRQLPPQQFQSDKHAVSLRRNIYRHHIDRLIRVRPVTNSHAIDAAKQARSFSPPPKMDYRKVLNQRKILQDELVENKRMRDLYKKRREDFEKRFTAAVGYQAPQNSAFVRKAIENEKKIINENVVAIL